MKFRAHGVRLHRRTFAAEAEPLSGLVHEVVAQAIVLELPNAHRHAALVGVDAAGIAGAAAEMKAKRKRGIGIEPRAFHGALLIG
jgi:hypothetical protein